MSPELAKLHCKVINHAANGGAVKRIPKAIVKNPNVTLQLGMWDTVLPHEDFNFEHYIYDFIEENPYMNMFAQKEAAKPPTKTIPFIAGKIAEEQCTLIKHFAEGGTVKRMPFKLRHVPGLAWEVMDFNDNFNFDYFEYRIVEDTPAYIRKQMREAAPTKTITVQAWFDGTSLIWQAEALEHLGYTHVPSQDITLTVPENKNGN